MSCLHRFRFFMSNCHRHLQKKKLIALKNERTLIFSRSFADNAENKNYDIVIVGGGIIGTATAREIAIRHPKLRLAILEKEDDLAKHQSGHNSGVVHAGIYYTPESLRAKLCVEGLNLSYKYFEEKNIPYKKIGKLIVATEQSELNNLEALHKRGIANKVPRLEVIDGDKIPEIQPHCRGIKALWSPETGIVDWMLVTRSYGKDFTERNGKIYFNFHVDRFTEIDSEYPVAITSSKNVTVHSKYVLTCAGLYSDVMAQKTNCNRTPRILPFRGEYLLLSPEKSKLIKTNIYPVPDPKFPFLGVHFTPRMDGTVWLGPNAVLAFKREGYTWFDVNIRELYDAISYPGFRKLASKYALFGFNETMSSIYISRKLKELQRFVPSIEAKDLSRGPAGVRAQALDLQGNLLDDFYFDSGEGSLGRRVLHCRNAPSPGATSSLAIAKMLADKVKEQFQIGA